MSFIVSPTPYYVRKYGAGGADSVAYTNFIARTSGLDATHISAYKGLLNGLTTDGLFNSDGTSNYLDCLYILATKDATTSLLNLVSSSFTITNSSMTFTADHGYLPSSGTDLDTGFNPTTASGHYIQDSAHAGFWMYATPESGKAYFHMGSSPALGQNMYPNFNGSGAFYARINDSPETGPNTVTPGLGFYMGNRSSSTGRQSYLNGADTGAYASSASGNFNNDTWHVNTSGTTAEVSALSLGGSLDATKAGNLYSRLRTYMTAVGVP